MLNAESWVDEIDGIQEKAGFLYIVLSASMRIERYTHHSADGGVAVDLSRPRCHDLKWMLVSGFGANRRIRLAERTWD